MTDLQKQMQLAQEALIEAKQKAGGNTDLAKALGQITSQAVSQWKVAPPNRVLAIESLTGVSRYRLRPDIHGEDPKLKVDA